MGAIDRRDIRFLALESLMVLLGVLVALFVDEWRQASAADAEAEAAVLRLAEEVRQNLRELNELDSVAAYRLGLLDDLEPELDGSQSLASMVGRFGGYRSPDLARSAWERISTGQVADRLPAAFREDAFRLYALHRYFDRLDEHVDRLVFSEAFHEPSRAPIALAISRRIMAQQRVWAQEFVPKHEAFLNAAR